jgi:hypothetical protein
MTVVAEDYDESATMDEDAGMTGPGAPTPLTALEVCRAPLDLRRVCARRVSRFRVFNAQLTVRQSFRSGRRRTHETRYSIGYRWRVQHCRVGSLHTETQS